MPPEKRISVPLLSSSGGLNKYQHNKEIENIRPNFPFIRPDLFITIKPCFTDTRLIQTPHYYGQFPLSLGKVLTFSVNSTCLIQTPIDANNRHFFLAQSTDSHIKSTLLMWTLYSQLCAATNLFLFEGEKPSVDIMSIFLTRKELLH